MAHLPNTQESKKGRNLRLWLWCLTIQCTLNFPGISAACKGSGADSMKIYPEGMFIEVKYGKPLEIFCEDNGAMADDIQFMTEAPSYIAIPSEKVNGTFRRLLVEKPGKGMNMYYCFNRKTRKYCNVLTVVDSVPQDVTDFHCRSKNIDELTCKWTSPEEVLPTRFLLTTVINGQTVDYCVPKYTKRWYAYCSWRQPGYRRFESQFLFTLKSSNMFGSNVQNFTVDHFSIVRPDPVDIYKVLNISAHSVVLQWAIPYNMAYLLPSGVEHKIEYMFNKTDNNSSLLGNQTRRVETPILSKKGEIFYTFLLSDLPYANLKFEVRISIKPLEATRDEFWSAQSSVTFQTTPEELVATSPGNLLSKL